MNTTVILYDKDPYYITSWRMILDVSEGIRNFGYDERFNRDLTPTMVFLSDDEKNILLANQGIMVLGLVLSFY